jgi:hypothetical protein
VTAQLNRKWLGCVVALLVATILLFAGAAVYAAHVRASAQALINSAYKIRSTEDAEREIATWRKRAGPKFWEETSRTGGDHNYDAQIENGLLSRFHFVEPTVVNLGVSMRDGKLRGLTLVMFTGREPGATSGVWIQEWFDPGMAKSFRVNDKDKPRRATVEFTSTVAEDQREKAFALNSKCFVQPKGCRDAEDILPTVWQLGTPLSSDLRLRSGL